MKQCHSRAFAVIFLSALVALPQGRTGPQGTAGATAEEEVKEGVVVEQVAKNSEAAKARLHEGDTLLRWTRGNANGKIESPFDLTWIEIEQAPRGAVTLEGLRNSQKLTWSLGPGDWGVTSRPNLQGTLLSTYREGQDLAKAGKLFSQDNVGTPETVYNASSPATVEKVEYDPFGERRNPSAIANPASLPSSRSVGFTGHEADDEFGLINMNGRIYDPQTARFLTPDPIVQAPFSSQSWNRYSYVYNNPVNFIDPSGFQCEDAPNCISNSGGGNGNSNGGGGGGGGEFQCGSWIPFACFFQGIGNLFKGGTSGPNTPAQPPAASQQTPTRADATRQGADAGTGWNFAPNAGSAVAESSGPNGTSSAGQICSACRGGGRIYATPFDVQSPPGDAPADDAEENEQEQSTQPKTIADRLLSNPQFLNAALRTAINSAIFTNAARTAAYGATNTVLGKPMGFNLVSAENAGGRAGVGITAAWLRQNALYDEVVATNGYPKASPPIPHFPGFANLFGVILSDSLQFALEMGQQFQVPSW